MTIRRILLTLALSALAALCPAVASADSIVYLKDGNVWIANADGSGARQFTVNAYGWHSPSEADDGTVVVAGGLARTNPDGSDSAGSSEIYRFQPDGNQIGTFTPTYGSYSTPSCPAYPPSRVRVSPDGSKIAYGIYGCGGGGYETALWTPSGSTGLSFPNQSIGQQDFWNPIWMDSSRFTISHSGPPVFGSHWGEHQVSDGDNVGGGWTEPAESSNAADAVTSRDGATAVVFFNDASSYTDGHPRNVSMRVYYNPAVPSDWTHASYGNPVCTISLTASDYNDIEHLDPSLSPDGTKVLWGSAAGVQLMSLGDLTNGCAGHSGQVTLIPGGSEPFYAKGNLHAGAANPNQPAPTTTTTNPGGSTPGGSTPGGSTPGGSTPGGNTPSNNGGTTTLGRLLAKFAVTTKKARMRAGRKIAFDARKSAEAHGKIVSYRWKFGDGKTGRGRTVTHKYRKPGTYTVALTVKDAAGRSATVRHKVKIER